MCSRPLLDLFALDSLLQIEGVVQRGQEGPAALFGCFLDYTPPAFEFGWAGGVRNAASGTEGHECGGSQLGALLERPLEFFGLVEERDVERYLVRRLALSWPHFDDLRGYFIPAEGGELDKVFLAQAIEQDYMVAGLHSQHTRDLVGGVAGDANGI